ncbi:hypothetical protein V8B97DRAFT_673491 [Scleroderma yunnanense]
MITKLVKIIGVVCLARVALAFPLSLGIKPKRDVDPSLVPQFGWQSGINPDGTGNCDGAVNGTNGKPILIPCQCPPNSTFFLSTLNQNVAAGFVLTNPSVKVTFPTDNSTASQLARLNAAAVTLQNLEGPGKGCPISSTTFTAQEKAIQAEGSSPGSAPTTTQTIINPTTPSPVAPTNSTLLNTAAGLPAPTPKTCTPKASSPATNATSSGLSISSNTTSPTDAEIVTLAPPLGWQSGINPDGTGNCDGAVKGTDGKPILIPCQCPPSQETYIANLTQNIRAGHVVLNPTVLLTFPIDNSTASQSARLHAAAVTIQNLNGAGKGCPISSTTFTAQQKAIDSQGTG